MRGLTFSLERFLILAVGIFVGLIVCNYFWSHRRAYIELLNNGRNDSHQISAPPDVSLNVWALRQHFKDESADQRLVSDDVLLKTMRFAIEERDEYDAELVSFVKSLIIPPPQSLRDLQFKKPNNDYSQIGQSPYMDNLLSKRRNGFFVEAGAYDGEIFSNSLFFEIERNWTGLLVEAIPSLFQRVLNKRRQVFAINACLSSKKPLIAKIRCGDSISGRTETMPEKHRARVDHEMGKNATYVYMPCFSLNTVLKALDVKKVDYFSLDVEGAEVDILRGLDHKAVDYHSFSIEHNGNADFANEIGALLKNNGFKQMKSDGQDAYYLKI